MGNEGGAALKLVDDHIPCFLCGQGKVSRTKLLRDLGIKEMADILQVGVEDVFRKLDTEGLKVLREMEQRLEETHRERLDLQKKDLERAQREAGALEARLKQATEELAAVRGKQKGNPADIGKSGELEFKSWADGQPRLECSEKLDKSGDYLVKLREDLNGTLVPINAPILVDNKKNKAITDGDLEKLLADARTRRVGVAMLVASSDSQLRKEDRARRVREKNGVLLVITSIERFLNDVEILTPCLHQLARGKDDGVDYQKSLERLVRAVTVKLAALDGIFEHTRKIRDHGDKVDAIVKSFKEDIAQACTES